MDRQKILSGIVKIAFTYLFILFLFMTWRFMGMEFANYLAYFAQFVVYFIPLGIPAWILFFVFSMLKKKMFQPIKPNEREVRVKKPVVGGTLFSDEELVEEK